MRHAGDCPPPPASGRAGCLNGGSSRGRAAVEDRSRPGQRTRWVGRRHPRRTFAGRGSSRSSPRSRALVRLGLAEVTAVPADVRDGRAHSAHTTGYDGDDAGHDARPLTASLALLLLTLLLPCGGSDDAGRGCRATARARPRRPVHPVAGAPVAGDAEPFAIAEQEHRVSGISGGHVRALDGVAIENPDDDVYGTFPTVSITGQDTAGKVVGHRGPGAVDSLPPAGSSRSPGRLCR